MAINQTKDGVLKPTPHEMLIQSGFQYIIDNEQRFSDPS